MAVPPSLFGLGDGCLGAAANGQPPLMMISPAPSLPALTFVLTFIA
jgi:hypothetical protein